MNNPSGLSKDEHHCFSGSMTCSGARMCGACMREFFMAVLPAAMAAGGFNRSEEQARAFYDGVAQGFQVLHRAMRDNPMVSPRVHRTNVTRLLQLQQMSQAKPPVAAPPAPVVPAAVARPPAPPPVAVKPAPPAAAAPPPTQAPARAPTRPASPAAVLPPADQERAHAAVRPMDAEEIAASAVAVSAPPTPRAVNGRNR